MVMNTTVKPDQSWGWYSYDQSRLWPVEYVTAKSIDLKSACRFV